jgi:hypothetical protein
MKKSSSTTRQRMHTTTARKRNRKGLVLVLDEIDKDIEKKYKHDKATNAHNDSKEKKQTQERVNTGKG